MTEHDFSGEISFTSSFEHEISADPYCALDFSETDDPTDVALEARVLASHWHGGQASALYSFSSSGFLDADACIWELGQCGPIDDCADVELAALLAFFEAVKPEDTSEDPCTDHDLDVCPDCGNAGTAIGRDGYYSCTRFLTCWADVEPFSC